MSTAIAPIRFLWDDDPQDASFHLGCLVQFGDSEPKASSSLSEDEREAVIAFVHSSRDARYMRMSARFVGFTADWTDSEVAERLEIEPGDIPLWRANTWLSVDQLALIADRAGWDLCDKAFWNWADDEEEVEV